MKSNFIIFVILTCLFYTYKINGQDAIVIGFNFDNLDGASVLALKDIPASQNIFITETGYDDAAVKGLLDANVVAQG